MYGRYHRLIVSSLHLWCHHACARHLSQSETWCTWGMKAPLLVLGIAETDEDPMNTRESFSTSICKEQTLMAEREFSAFISAVKELLGPDQAQLSALDWLDELELMDSQPGTTNRHWREVTIAASARLANRFERRDRMIGNSPKTSTNTKVSTIPSSNCFAIAPL